MAGLICGCSRWSRLPGRGHGLPRLAAQLHYYRRLCLTSGGLAIMTRLASDAALERTAFLISHVTEAVDPRVLASMNSHGFRHAVMAAYPLELTTDIPEHAWLSPASYWDERARGLGEWCQVYLNLYNMSQMVKCFLPWYGALSLQI